MTSFKSASTFLHCVVLSAGFSLLTVAGSSPAFAQIEKMIYSFGANGSGPGGDGYNPQSGLTTDGHGNLYGTTYEGGAYGAGTVFELSPPLQAGGAWTEAVLYSFQQPSGWYPSAGVVFDKSGNLYGTTGGGGEQGGGVVYELTPPAGGAGPWTETVIYSFVSRGSGDTGLNGGGVVFVKGNLYAVTLRGGNGNGNVLELKPPSELGGSWLVKQVFTFEGGSGGSLPLALGGALVADAAGNLYGTALGGPGGAAGIVFELSPPSSQNGSWAEAVLYALGTSVFAPLIFDQSGNLYGTAAPYTGLIGTSFVFELSPPSQAGQPWTESTLYSFSSANGQNGYDPYGGLVFDKAGNLYGTTAAGGTSSQCGKSGCGTVFELSPPTQAGGSWTEAVLHNFTDHLTDGMEPATSLTIDPAGHLYGVTFGGGAYGNGGSAFKVVP